MAEDPAIGQKRLHDSPSQPPSKTRQDGEVSHGRVDQAMLVVNTRWSLYLKRGAARLVTEPFFASFAALIGASPAFLLDAISVPRRRADAATN